MASNACARNQSKTGQRPLIIAISALLAFSGCESGAPLPLPSTADSDADGLFDQDEALFGTNPLVSDTDGDQIPDGEEVQRGLNPLLSDSDRDGIADFQELAQSTNPIDSDTDDDGLSDGEESAIGTSPRNADSDGDTLSDKEEIALGTNPLSVDTDTDTLKDGLEVFLGLSATTPNAVGAIDEKYCSDFIGIRGLEGTTLVSVFERGFGGSFFLWLVGDRVVVAGNGNLVNLSNPDSAAATNVGRYQSSSWISSVANDGSSIVLADGSEWSVSFLDQIFVSLWLPVSNITVVKRNIQFGGWSLINELNCDRISVTPR